MTLCYSQHSKVNNFQDERPLTVHQCRARAHSRRLGTEAHLLCSATAALTTARRRIRLRTPCLCTGTTASAQSLAAQVQ